jgi:hypothetical protein
MEPSLARACNITTVSVGPPVSEPPLKFPLRHEDAPEPTEYCSLESLRLMAQLAIDEMFGRMANAEGRLYEVRIDPLSLHPSSCTPATIPDDAEAQAPLF